LVGFFPFSAPAGVFSLVFPAVRVIASPCFFEPCSLPFLLSQLTTVGFVFPLVLVVSQGYRWLLPCPFFFPTPKPPFSNIVRRVLGFLSVPQRQFHACRSFCMLFRTVFAHSSVESPARFFVPQAVTLGLAFRRPEHNDSGPEHFVPLGWSRNGPPKGFGHFRFPVFFWIRAKLIWKVLPLQSRTFFLIRGVPFGLLFVGEGLSFSHSIPPSFFPLALNLSLVGSIAISVGAGPLGPSDWLLVKPESRHRFGFCGHPPPFVPDYAAPFSLVLSGRNPGPPQKYIEFLFPTSCHVSFLVLTPGPTPSLLLAFLILTPT